MPAKQILPSGRSLDRIVAACLIVLVSLVCIAYLRVFLDIAAAGLDRIDIAFLTQEPRMSGRAGGVLPMIVSTLVVLAVAVAVALPISLACALFVTEYLPPGSRWSNVFRASMLILACVPSIAFGFFGSVFFAEILGLRTSLLTGGLTLATMIIPICAFALEEAFRLLPSGYRYGAYALGASRARFIFLVLIPVSAPQIVTVVLLGMGRALAETAALLFTSGYSDRMPTSLLDPGRVLSVHIYDLGMNIPGGNAMASASALLLLGMFLTISALGLMFSRHLSFAVRT